jgi:hypothetical protein
MGAVGAVGGAGRAAGTATVGNGVAESPSRPRSNASSSSRTSRIWRSDSRASWVSKSGRCSNSRMISGLTAAASQS